VGGIAEAMARVRQETRKNYSDIAAALKELPAECPVLAKLREALQRCRVESDWVRDEFLPELGIKLEDVADGSVAFKIGDPEDVKAQKAKKALAQPPCAKKGPTKRAYVENAAEVFAREVEKYSQFDAQGKPTHDKEGKELSKSQMKNVDKRWEALSKKRARWEAEGHD
jgi:cysteinyl-tRNA synthetase